MWVYIPTNSYQSVQEQEDSISGLSVEVANELSQSAMWRTSLLPPRSWRRVWKINAFLQHLFGPTLKLSIFQRGKALKESQEDILAHRLMLQDRDWVPPIPDTYGTLLQKESRQLSLFGASSRMSAHILHMDFLQSAKTFSAWATKLRQHSLQRRKSALHTNENDYLSWESNNQLWITPMGEEANKKPSGSLARQVDPGAKCEYRKRIHQDPRVRNGITYLPIFDPLYLNPNFVEWLMGWDIGWTSLDRIDSE